MVLGSQHPDSLSTLQHLAMVLKAQGQYDATEELYVRALKGMEASLGPEHRDTLNAVHCFAVLLHDEQRYVKASAFYVRAYQGYFETLGPDRKNIQHCFRDYLSMLDKMEREGIISEEEHEIPLRALRTMTTTPAATCSQGS